MKGIGGMNGGKSIRQEEILSIAAICMYVCNSEKSTSRVPTRFFRK